MDFAALAKKYVGATAAGYEQHREQGEKWRAEDEAAGELLREVDLGARALDVPVGTGRLLAHLKARRFDVHGLDASSDMLAIARGRANTLGKRVELRLADIRTIPYQDDYFDIVTCLRFLNWVDAKGVEQVVEEVARVSRGKLLLGIRYLPPLKEVVQGPQPLVRLGMRVLGAPRRRERRSGLRFQQKSFIEGLFKRLGLAVVRTRLIERRFDGTDYVFFLLSTM
jgi:SAM-dependent methyltransferase